MDLQAIEIESILYEDAVESLLSLMESRDFLPDTTRELHLARTTSMLLEYLDSPGKLASIAAMSLVMLHEERKKKHVDRGHRAKRR